jgi:hypothetical protein
MLHVDKNTPATQINDVDTDKLAKEIYDLKVKVTKLQDNEISKLQDTKYR